MNVINFILTLLCLFLKTVVYGLRHIVLAIGLRYMCLLLIIFLCFHTVYL